jgi:hypothetical protein
VASAIKDVKIRPGARPGIAVVACAAAILGLAGCAVSGTDQATEVSASHGSTTKGQGGGASGSALKLLATIKIKGRAPTTGYTRDKFGPAWADTDHNGCDQRNDILRRDLTGETLKARTHGCIVLTGTLADRYTGKTIHFTKTAATAVQIDHVVALQDAWVTGAYKWTEKKRQQLATDPLNLLAVDGSTNESKGSGDAATWLPPQKSYRCAYVARQVAVKAKYDAWMTAAEEKAIEKILAGCNGEKVPQSAASIPLGDDGSGSTAPATSKAGGSKSPADPVTAGAYCSPEGDTGVTSSGTKVKCTSKDGDRPRWRSS